MPAIEGQTSGLSIICFDDHGNAAASARDAHTLFVSWFFSNPSSHDVKLTFPKGQLFNLTLTDDTGAVYWQSPNPAPAQDFVAVVKSADRFAIPINPQPPGLPQQNPTVPLSDIISDKKIAATTELNLETAILLASGTQRMVTRLWRAF